MPLCGDRDAAPAKRVMVFGRNEGPLSNADTVGAYLRAGLIELAERHPGIRDVRGAGLYVGVELRDAALAHDVVNGLRRARILIGGDVTSISARAVERFLAGTSYRKLARRVQH